MKTTYAYTPYFTATTGRLIAGVFIHDTETHLKAAPHPEGSWHYEIDRDGTILQFVHEDDIAWHVRACDRWWPSWLPRWGDYDLSRANEWSIGIELVSDVNWRTGGQPYTPAQYAALNVLLADIFARRGALPVVGHGQVQADRSDPVLFDWGRTGLVWREDGYRQPAGAPVSDLDMERIKELEAQLQAMTAERDNLNGIATTLGKQLEYKDTLLQAADSRAGALQEALNNTQRRTVARITFSDGGVQDVTAH